MSAIPGGITLDQIEGTIALILPQDIDDPNVSDNSLPTDAGKANSDISLAALQKKFEQINSQENKLNDEFGDKFLYEVCRVKEGVNKINLLHWLSDRGLLSESRLKILLIASTYFGNIDFLDWLIDYFEFNDIVSNKIFIILFTASKCGELNVIQYIEKNFDIVPTNRLIDIASMYGKIRCLNYWFKYCKSKNIEFPYTEKAIDECKFVESLEWWNFMRENHRVSLKYTNKSIRYYAAHNLLSMLDWFFDNSFDIPEVKFLSESIIDDFGTKEFDEMSINVLYWFLRINIEFHFQLKYTEKAMENIIQNSKRALAVFWITSGLVIKVNEKCIDLAIKSSMFQLLYKTLPYFREKFKYCLDKALKTNSESALRCLIQEEKITEIRPRYEDDLNFNMCIRLHEETKCKLTGAQPSDFIAMTNDTHKINSIRGAYTYTDIKISMLDKYLRVNNLCPPDTFDLTPSDLSYIKAIQHDDLKRWWSKNAANIRGLSKKNCDEIQFHFSSCVIC